MSAANVVSPAATETRSSAMAIPFTRPYLTGVETAYVADAVSRTAIGSDGKYTRLCSQLLERQFGSIRTLMTPSCTAALEIAASLVLQPGDEALVPSFTFTSTANAVLLAGARPVFVDIRPDTLNMDEQLLEQSITPRTKAIIPVHYGGISCDMDAIMAVAARHGLKVIEDAAQGVNSFYKGRALGSVGHLGAYSFHHTKNYTCGEGGALCVNDASLADRADVLREKGTNRSRFLRGEVDKYTWVDAGTSGVPSELNCAFLYAQLHAMNDIRQKRRIVFERYQSMLSVMEKIGLLRLPCVPEDCTPNYHVFYILLRDQSTRDDLLHWLGRLGIQAQFHYVPLHSSPMGVKLGCDKLSLPVTEDLSGRLLRLPFHALLSEAEQASVVASIRKFFRNRRVREVPHDNIQAIPRS